MEEDLMTLDDPAESHDDIMEAEEEKELAKDHTGQKSDQSPGLPCSDQCDPDETSVEESGCRKTSRKASKSPCKIQQGAVFSGKILSFGCSECKGDATYSPNDLLKHFQGAHKGTLPTYPCDLCGFVTNEFPALQRHRIGHRNTLVTCEICNDDVQYSLLLLTRHYIMSHSQNGHFHCEKCEFSTVDAGTFVQHIHHHNESLLKCVKCQHVSSSRGEHQRHLKLHSGTFPFTCQVCGYGAARREYLTKHMVTVHGEDADKKNIWRATEDSNNTLANSSSGLKLLLKKSPAAGGQSKESQWMSKLNSLPGVGLLDQNGRLLNPEKTLEETQQFLERAVGVKKDCKKRVKGTLKNEQQFDSQAVSSIPPPKSQESDDSYGADALNPNNSNGLTVLMLNDSELGDKMSAYSSPNVTAMEVVPDKMLTDKTMPSESAYETMLPKPVSEETISMLGVGDLSTATDDKISDPITENSPVSNGETLPSNDKPKETPSEPMTDLTPQLESHPSESDNSKETDTNAENLNTPNQEVFSFHNYSKETSSISSNSTQPCEHPSELSTADESVWMKESPEWSLTLAASPQPPDEGSGNGEVETAKETETAMERVSDSDIEVDECIATVEDLATPVATEEDNHGHSGSTHQVQTTVNMEEESVPVSERATGSISSLAVLGRILEEHSDAIISHQLEKDRIGCSASSQDSVTPPKTMLRILKTAEGKQQMFLQTAENRFAVPVQLQGNPGFKLITKSSAPQINVSYVKPGIERQNHTTGLALTLNGGRFSIPGQTVGASEKGATLLSAIQPGASTSASHYLVNSTAFKASKLSNILSPKSNMQGRVRQQVGIDGLNKSPLAPRPSRQLSQRKRRRKALFDELPEHLPKVKRLSNKAVTEKGATSLWVPVPKDAERTLRLYPFSSLQEIKCPRRNQPVVVLNHPDADIPEVASIMRSANKYKGAVSKVALSQKTVQALSELSPAGLLGKSSKVKCPSSQSSGSRLRPSESRVRERFLLKLKFRKTSRKKYEVVKSLSRSAERSSMMFACWFCGRLFNNQEEWIGHGQRHLMEATRDWNKPF
ncbi:hypothetical protein J4Q44_G00282150 [Coregonus suidteri]|uniref:C2H2-type domain-containing protein n=1 Tax=Coregonus suidteri TaxID=861788 RepID=A0AAN8L026_9TELE